MGIPCACDADQPGTRGCLFVVSTYRFDPATYMELMRAEVPLYATLQETIAVSSCSVGGDGAVAVSRILDLGTGTGGTLAQVLARHPEAHAVGVDENDDMLAAATERLVDYDTELVVADLLDPLPEGPFDLVVSALAIHHLTGPGKAELFSRLAGVLRPGGRFVLGDVVLGVDEEPPPADEHDKPSTVAEQVQWMEDAGFTVEVIWQGDDLAVFTADRPN